jgi:hypothetical protein
MPVRMTLISVSRLFRSAIFPVPWRSASLCRRSCQTRMRPAIHVVARAMSHASANAATMTATRPQVLERGLSLWAAMSRASMSFPVTKLGSSDRIGSVSAVTRESVPN